MGISCIVLASGMSTRMKRNKLLMKLNNKMVFEYILDTIKEINFDEVIVVTRFREIIDYCYKLKYTVVINKEFFEGQSRSIRLGIEKAKKENDYIFFVADQPKISKETIEKVLYKYTGKEDEFIIPYYYGKKGNPVIFGKNYRNDLLNLKGDIGGSYIINKYKEKIKRVNIFNNENKDIDNLDDFEDLRREYER